MMLFVSFISQLIVKGTSLNRNVSFRKPTSPPLPLREGPPLISVFFNSLYDPFDSPCRGQKPQGKRVAVVFFRIPPSPFPKGAPHPSPSLSLLRRARMCQPPYSVLKPLRYKVGGPSEVSPAAELRFAVCDRMDTNRLRAACCLLEACLVLARRRAAECQEAHNSTP